MAEEIERKFLVVSDAWKEEAGSGVEVVQGYLSSNAKATVRVRTYDNERAVLTIKGPSAGISRSEFEYEVPLLDAQAMLRLAEPHVVRKMRFKVRYAGLVWEVDVFEGAHLGLVVAEVELEAVDQSIDRPAWVGAEVSHDDRYANASLSRTAGVPQPDASA